MSIAARPFARVIVHLNETRRALFRRSSILHSMGWITFLASPPSVHLASLPPKPRLPEWINIKSSPSCLTTGDEQEAFGGRLEEPRPVVRGTEPLS